MSDNDFDPLEDSINFDLYWYDLQELGKKHNERILDKDGWRDPFDEGKTAREAFFEEFPEHK